MQKNSPIGEKQPGALSAELHTMLLQLGRTLGIIAAYGTDHPIAVKALDDAFAGLQAVLQTSGSIALGTVKGELTVNGKPVTAKDAPVKALEKRLTSMQLSHLSLKKGLSTEDFRKLITALSTGKEEAKASISKAGGAHVNVEEVQYVALREGETKVAKGAAPGAGPDQTAGGHDGPSSVQVGQIVAFLKGDAGSTDLPDDVKKMLSEPEKLGQMILEAAAVRQQTASLEGGENLADIVIGCLRRTYDGLRSESEFETARGKATLAQTMLLLEKSVLDRIRSTLDPGQPDLDRRIMAEIRAMESEREFDLLSTHYAEQCQKRDKTEEKIVALIRQQGSEKARALLAGSGIPVQDWQRLLVQGSGSPPSAGGPGGGADMGIIATVLERLDGLMQMANRDPQLAKAAVQDARRGVSDYASRMESQIDEMEDRVHHHERKDREDIILEMSKLTLSLMQPLTVINGSIETALSTADEALRNDLLDLAYQSSQSMEVMTKRMISLTGYPELSEADGHLNEWKKSS